MPGVACNGISPRRFDRGTGAARLDGMTPIPKTRSVCHRGLDERAIAPDMLVEEVDERPMHEALREIAIGALFDGCCNRLFAAEPPPSRAHFPCPTLHPLRCSVVFIEDGSG